MEHTISDLEEEYWWRGSSSRSSIRNLLRKHHWIQSFPILIFQKPFKLNSKVSRESLLLTLPLYRVCARTECDLRKIDTLDLLELSVNLFDRRKRGASKGVCRSYHCFLSGIFLSVCWPCKLCQWISKWLFFETFRISFLFAISLLRFSLNLVLLFVVVVVNSFHPPTSPKSLHCLSIKLEFSSWLPFPHPLFNDATRYTTLATRMDYRNRSQLRRSLLRVRLSLPFSPSWSLSQIRRWLLEVDDRDTNSSNPCAVWDDPRPAYYASLSQGHHQQQNYSSPPPLVNSSSYPSQSQSTPYAQSQSQTTYDQHNSYGQPQQNSYGSQPVQPSSQYSSQPSHNPQNPCSTAPQHQQKEDKGFLGNLMNSVNGKQQQGAGGYNQQRLFFLPFPFLPPSPPWSLLVFL